LIGAISATLRIARPHRLQILCATGLNIVAPHEKPAQQTYTGNVNKF